MFKFIALFLLAIGTTNGNMYDGQQMLGVHPQTAQQVKDLQAYLDATELKIVEKILRAGQQMMFLVHVDDAKTVTDHINQKFNLKVEVVMEDVGRTIADEKNRLKQQRALAQEEGRLAFNISDFNTYEDMMSQLDVFASQCVDLGFSCDVVTAGQSYEGNDIKYLKINKDDGARLGIWIDSLIHAREWIVGPTTMNIIDRLLSSYGTDDTVTRLVDTYTWYFLPVVNPDGYQYTWSDDRLWRKSRNPNDGSTCIGTDLNRNFDQQWMNAGSSTNPCSDTYAGSGPGSELETQVMQGLADSLGLTMRAWISMHSAADMWLHPYGSVDDQGVCERSEFHDDLYQVAEAAAIATMNTWGTTWTYGSICETIYPASGSTCDYVHAQGGVKYSYTPELRGDGYGFVIPPEQIPFALEETWNGIVALIDEAASIESGR